MTRTLLLALALTSAAGCSLPATLTTGEAASPAAAEAPESLYDIDLTALDGSDFDAASLKGKAVLFVNVASKCGFTPQYEGLQALYETYGERGLVVVGTPCNQFAGQEPGSGEEIATFCKMNYGVTFPLLAKAKVNGKERAPLYQFLIASEKGGGAKIGWNFEKFLVSPEGEVVGRWGSRTTPQSDELVKAIEGVLPKKGS